MKRKLCLLLTFALLCALFAGCGEKKEKFSAYSFDWFDTVTTITGYAASQAEFDRVSGEALSLLGEYHRLFTIYTRYEGLENLCTLNDKKEATLDRRVIDLLLYGKRMYEVTGGKTNIAMGSVLSIWHDYRTIGMDDPAAAKLPPMDALQAAAAHTNIEDIIIDEETCTVRLADPDMTLDVGAVAKGYAVEMVARHLEAQGVTGYVLNVGGNVRTVGLKADGTAWVAGVEDPEGEGYLATVSLIDEALVTSGSYQRYYIVNGTRYHHIIDPETLMPSGNFTSVSVRTASSADGDALSTALFCMTFEEGRDLIDSLEGTEAMWLTADGTVHKTAGFDR